MCERFIQDPLSDLDDVCVQVAEGIRINKEAPNDTLLTYARMRNEHVRNGYIDLVMEYYTRRASSGKPAYERVYDTHGNPARSETGDPLFRTHPYSAPTREEIATAYDERCARVATYTDIAWNGNEPNAYCMDLAWRIPGTHKKPTAKQYAIIEAHEKGHAVREYPCEGSINPIDERFREVFDWSAVPYTHERYEAERSENEREESYEEARERFYEYMRRPEELVERMAQLKNYFGMRGDEVCTHAHIAYARAHYSDDLAFDNRMTPFFEAITPEREEAFLTLINSIGV